MIRQYTRLRVADNTGARTLQCITDHRPLAGGHAPRWAT